MGGRRGTQNNGHRVHGMMRKMCMERVVPEVERVTCFVGEGSKIDHMLQEKESNRKISVRIEQRRIMQSDHACVEMDVYERRERG
jgi:hypothetical protein